MKSPAILFFLLLSTSLFSQDFGTVRGTIFDESGTTIIGSTVSYTDPSGELKGTSTDLDGKFTLKVPAGVQTSLVFKFIGMADKTVDVQVSTGEVEVLEVMMTSGVDLNIIDVVEKLDRGEDIFMRKMQEKSSAAFSYVSKATLKQTGDSDMGAAVKRVSGVSTTGDFVSVRGLSDRYLVTGVNGSRIPTLDPFTNNIRLDLFPAGLIDNLIVTKTMTPDVPGDWAGAYMSIETMDYPDKLDVRVSTSFGYNTNATGSTIPTTTPSDTDWLGYDNGFRDIPDLLNSDQADLGVVNYSTSNNMYDIFNELGYGDVMSDYGFTEETYLSQNSILTHVMLVEMGLLGTAQIGDQQAVDAALDQFNNTSHWDAVNSIGDRVTASQLAFNNQSIYADETEGQFDFSQSFTIGNQLNLANKDSDKSRPLGYLFGYRYSRDTNYDPNGVTGNSVVKDTTNVTSENSLEDLYREFQPRRVANIDHGWSALAKLAFKPNEKNDFSLMFMPNMYGSNNARIGYVLDFPDNAIRFRNEQFYEERKQFIYQYGSSHYLNFKSAETKVALNVSYTDGQSNTLDFMDWVAQVINPSTLISTLEPDSPFEELLSQEPLEIQSDQPPIPRRVFRFLDEDILDGRLSFETNILSGRDHGLKSSLLYGLAYRQHERVFTETVYNIQGDVSGFTVDELPLVFSDTQFTVDSGQVGFEYSRTQDPGADNVGISKISSAYVGWQHEWTRRLRTTLGARLERTSLIHDLNDFYELGIASDAEERGGLDQVSIEQDDLLPSLNVLYKLTPADDKKVTNLRLAYFKSLSRPGLREISPYGQIYEYSLQSFVVGNDSLQLTQIDNFDVRYEKFITGKGMFALGGFYKTFQNHIELISDIQGLSWSNAPESHAFGFEVEGKMKLIGGLSAFGNLSIIESETEFTSFTGKTVKRDMFGQAPYIINVAASYKLDSLDMDFTVAYNRQGPKLAVVNNSNFSDVGIVDVLEMPMDIVDMTLRKKFGDHWGVSFRVRNLLNQTRKRVYYVEDAEQEIFFDRFNAGTDFSIGFSYTN